MATADANGASVVGVVYEVRTIGEGVWWAHTLAGAHACAARRKNPRSITPYHLHIGARITSAGPTITVGARP